MSQLQAIGNFTVLTAREAVREYFAPLVDLAGWLHDFVQMPALMRAAERDITILSRQHEEELSALRDLGAAVSHTIKTMHDLESHLHTLREEQHPEPPQPPIRMEEATAWQPELFGPLLPVDLRQLLSFNPPRLPRGYQILREKELNLLPFPFPRIQDDVLLLKVEDNVLVFPIAELLTLLQNRGYDKTEASKMILRALKSGPQEKKEKKT